jgi:hypothetical protein
MFRPDFPLVRHLAESMGVYAAQQWQSLPYILLPGEGFAAYAMDHVSGSGLPPPDRLPWPDAVYDFPEGTAQILRRLWQGSLGDQEVTPTLPNRGRCWMRVRTTREPGDGYLVETWEEQVSTGGLPPGPDITFVPWERAPYRALPHYILIDPQRAHEYGRTESPGGEGHHASPRPHTRRGHWRELRADRYEREVDGAPRKLWIKPAWVGASEWTSEGARYRVVPPRF